MINSDIRTFTYPDGNIQRVQCVRFDDWRDLDFLIPKYSEDAFQGIVALYRDFFMPRLSLIEGRVVLFRVPDDLELPDSFMSVADETFYDRTAAVTAMFRKNVSFKRRKLSFSDQNTDSRNLRTKQARQYGNRDQNRAFDTKSQIRSRCKNVLKIQNPVPRSFY